MNGIRVIARRIALCAALLVTIGAGAARANSVSPLTIPPSFQLFVAVSGTFVVVSLPGGSLGLQNGLPSDPFTGVIIDSFGFGGSSGGTQSPLQFDTPVESTSLNHSKIEWEYKAQKQPASTILKQPAKVTLNNIGDSSTVPLEIVSLSLMSVSPVTITYGNGPFSSFFDVFVVLDPVSIQQPGSLTLVRTGVNSGSYAFSLPITYQVTFMNTNPSGPTGGPFVFTDTFTASGTFQVAPEPGTLLLFALGAAGILARRRISQHM